MLADCLGALLVSLAPLDELVVVDSCSRTGATAAVAERRGARLLRCDTPGASLARNTGWRAARHDDVAFVDDDVRVSAPWANALRAALGSHPEAAFVTGRLGLGSSPTPVERPVAVFDRAEPAVIDRAVGCDIGHGANMAVRRAALSAVGGFDEAFGPGARWPAAEDLDLLDRLLGAGFVGRYEPSVEATHAQWRTRRDLVRLEWSYGTGQGARLARLWSGDRSRARLVTPPVVWDDGVKDLATCVRRGYEFGALLAGARLAATVRGALGYRAARGRPSRVWRRDR
jgi:glycosyltransferase involved in cell wall biosynthesis